MRRRTLLQLLGLSPLIAAPGVAYAGGPIVWFPHVSVQFHDNPKQGYKWGCTMAMTCPVTGRRAYDMVVATEAPAPETQAVYIAQLTNSLMSLMYRRMANLKETT